jgi:hypothetical protein
MQPILDGDVLVYEIGFAAETGWKATINWEGEDKCPPPPFSYVAELLDNRIAEICGKVMATQPPLLYLTGKDNFREKIAKKKVYKGNRDGVNKPWHYANLISYMRVAYNTIVVEGMEADDAMCIEQCKAMKEAEEGIEYTETIICTRDKDLRQCPGWGFSWELGNQPQWGPEFVEGFGYLSLSDDNKKLRGVGDAFFYAQLIMGDPVDNIPGIPGKGAKAAFDILGNTHTRAEAEKAVVEAYRAFYGELWEQEMLEQAQLLWMVRELDEEGKPVMWGFLDE